MSMGSEYMDDHAYEIDNGMEPGFYLDTGEEDNKRLPPVPSEFAELVARSIPLSDGTFIVRPYIGNGPGDFMLKVEIADGGKTARVRTADWKPAPDFIREEFSSCVHSWLYCAIVPHLGADMSEKLAEAVSEEVRPPAPPETLAMDIASPFTSSDLMYISEDIEDTLRCFAYDAAHNPATVAAVKEALAAKLAALSAKAVEAVQNA